MNQRDEKYVKMTTAPVERLVCSFAAPAMVCMLISSIYNLADTFFVGSLGNQQTASLGIVFSYMGIIQALAFYVGHGSGNFISINLGAKKYDAAENMASTGFFLAIAAASAIALLCGIFIRPVLTAFGSTRTVLPYAVSYFRWILAGTPFIVGAIVLNNQMRLQGNAALSMYGLLSGGLLNIALDPVFIFVLKLGVEGAGIATAISQCVSFLILLRLCGLRGGIKIKLRNFKPSWYYCRMINAGGLPSLARQGLMAVATAILNNFAGTYGDEALAAFSVVGRVMPFASSLIIGFGQGFQPVCGYNYGARMYGRLRRALRFCIICSSAYAALVAVLGECFAPEIISFFRDDADVIALGSLVLRAHCAAFPLVGFVTLTNMYLQTTNQTLSAVTLAIARHGLFLIPMLILGNLFFGFGGIVASQPLSDICSFILAIPLYRASVRRLNGEMPESKIIIDSK